MTHHVDIRWLTPDELTTIPDLQRKLSGPRASKMAADWDPQLVGVLEGAELVDSEGEQIVHLIDGQTRAEAARIYGDTNGVKVIVPVAVYEGLDRQAIAALFLARNRLSSKVHAFDAHKVGLVAKDPLAQTVQAGIDRTKFTLARQPSDYEVACAGTVTRFTKNLIRRFDADHARDNIVKVFEIVAEAWAFAGKDRVNGDIVEALSWMLNEHTELQTKGSDWSGFVEVLEKMEPTEWMHLGKEQKTKGVSSGARYKGICKVWTEAWRSVEYGFYVEYSDDGEMFNEGDVWESLDAAIAQADEHVAATVTDLSLPEGALYVYAHNRNTEGNE